MITVVADGFLAEDPVLRVLSQTAQVCEFTLLWKRSVRSGNEWGTVWERATFVAWNEEAEKVANRLEKGAEVSCTGVQETTSSTDGSGNKRYYTKYRLTYWQKKSRSDGAKKSQDSGRPEQQDPRSGGYSRGQQRVQSQQRPPTRERQEPRGVRGFHEERDWEQPFDGGYQESGDPHSFADSGSGQPFM